MLRTKRCLAVTLALGIAGLASAGAQPANPGIDELCSLKDEHYRVQVLKTRACCPAEVELRIQDLTTRLVDVVQFETSLERLYTHRIFVDSQFVVVGHRPPGGYAVLMADLAQRTVVEAWTSNHQFSPDQRWLAYVSARDLALDGPPGVWIYALGGSTPSAEPLRPGERIYPEPDDPQPGQVVSPLLFTRDGQRLYFVDWWQKRARLVEIDVGGNRSVKRHGLALALEGGFRSPIVELLREGADGLELRLAGRRDFDTVRWSELDER